MEIEKLRKKLLSRLNNGGRPANPTPVQIEHQIHNNGFLADIIGKTGINNPALLEAIFKNGDGRYQMHKLPEFIKSLKNIRQKPLGEEMLSFLEPKDVRRDGSIRPSRLKRCIK